MRKQELILNETDIKALFMNDNVAEICRTRDIKAFNLTEQESNDETIEDFKWTTIVDFGMKNIISEEFFQVEKVSYDEVCAVKVEWKGNDETQTFINKNFTKIINW